MGAATVLETPAATPASMKFSKNPSFLESPILRLYWSVLVLEIVKYEILILSYSGVAGGVTEATPALVKQESTV